MALLHAYELGGATKVQEALETLWRQQEQRRSQFSEPGKLQSLLTTLSLAQPPTIESNKISLERELRGQRQEFLNGGDGLGARDTLVGRAVALQDLSTLTILADKRWANDVQLHLIGSAGTYPLHQAVLSNSPALIQAVLKLPGAESALSYLDSQGLNVLHVAALHNLAAAINTLAPALAVSDAMIWQKRSSHEGPAALRGRQAIHLAAERGHISALLALLAIPELSANAISYLGFTALHCAAVEGRCDVAEVLLGCPRTSVNASDFTGATPLHIAAQRGWTNFAALMLNHSAIPEWRNLDGDTPLHLAARGGHLPVASLLLQAAPVLYQPYNKLGQTPAAAAQQAGHVEIASMLGTAALQQGLPHVRWPELKPLDIHVISDTHIEFYATEEQVAAVLPLTPPARYLALLGDIGVLKEGKQRERYTRFLDFCSSRYEMVFVIAGNHEFYHGEVSAVHSAIVEACGAASRKNVFYIENGEVEIEGRVVLGCTLWSHVPAAAASTVAGSLNDYRLIMNGKAALSVEDTNEWHAHSVSWLRARIDAATQRSKPIVVLTHHAPLLDLGTSDPTYYGGAMTHAFCSDLRHLLGKNVVAWAYGHTHWFHDMTLFGTRIVSIPVGYPHEKLSQLADRSFVLRV